MERPEFTREQEEWLCEALDDWYLEWKNKMAGRHPHNLGIAKEQFKAVLCGAEPNKFIEHFLKDN